MTAIPSSFLNLAPRVSDFLAEIELLLEDNRRKRQRVSIYLPEGEPSSDAANLVGERLMACGLGAEEVASYLGSIDFEASGSAVFSDGEGSHVVAAPGMFSELEVHVSPFWQLTPLLSLAANVDACHVLALGARSVRLLRCSRLGVRDVTPDSVVASFAASGAGEFLGPEQPADGEQERLRLFLTDIGGEISKILKNSTDPLLLAGAEFCLPVLRESAEIPCLSEQCLSVDVDRISPETLRDQSLDALRNDFQQSTRRKLLWIHEKLDDGGATTELQDALVEAARGNVVSAILPSDLTFWGRWDEGKERVVWLPETDPSGRDLFQLVGELTLDRGGELFYLEQRKMPAGNDLCVELRN